MFCYFMKWEKVFRNNNTKTVLFTEIQRFYFKGVNYYVCMCREKGESLYLCGAHSTVVQGARPLPRASIERVPGSGIYF